MPTVTDTQLTERQRRTRTAFNKTRLEKGPRMTGHRLLTTDEETRLCGIVQGKLPGDPDRAIKELIERNTGLIHKLAGKWCDPNKFPYEDAVQEATLGFMTACDKFDPSRNCKLGTLASPWITQRLSRARDHNAHIIHIPAHALEELRLFQRRVAKLTDRLGHEPSDEEVHRHLHLSPKQVQKIKDLPLNHISVDAPVEHDNGRDDTLLVDVLAEPVPSLDADLFVRDFDLKAVAEGCLSHLPNNKSRDVMRRRFGFPPYPNPQSLQEVADVYAMSREGVRQIEVRAIQAIRVALGLPNTIEPEEEKRSGTANLPKARRPATFQELHDRNDAILAELEAGRREWELSSRFGISGSRVRQAAAEARKRRTGRP